MGDEIDRIMNEDEWDASSGEDVDTDDEEKKLAKAKASRKSKGKVKEAPKVDESVNFSAPPVAPEGWPVSAPLPHNTSVAAAGQWYAYIPRTQANAEVLRRNAQKDEQAHARVGDLISQANHSSKMRAVEGILSLIRNWRPPRPEQHHEP